MVAVESEADLALRAQLHLIQSIQPRSPACLTRLAPAQDIFTNQCKDEPEVFQEPCDRAVPCEGDASQPVKLKEEFEFNVRPVPGNALCT